MNKNFVRYWVPVILWLFFIFWMATGTFSSENSSLVIEPVLRFLAPTISSQTVELIHGIVRKAGHVIEYLILGLLLFRAFRGPSDEPWMWRWAAFAVIGVVLWALSDEFHQSFVPTRTASLGDVGFDAAGGILAQFIGALWFYRREKQRKH
jgi:VanZ family protein